MGLQVISNNFNIQYDFNTVLFQSKNNQDYSGAYSVASLLKPSRGDVRYADQQERGYTSSCRNQDIANHYANICKSKGRSISQIGYPANPLLLVHVMIIYDNELWNQWLGDPAFISFVSALFDISTNQPMAFASKLSSSNNVLAFGNQALSLWLYMEIAQCRIVECISVENLHLPLVLRIRFHGRNPGIQTSYQPACTSQCRPAAGHCHIPSLMCLTLLGCRWDAPQIWNLQKGLVLLYI